MTDHTTSKVVEAHTKLMRVTDVTEYGWAGPPTLHTQARFAHGVTTCDRSLARKMVTPYAKTTQEAGVQKVKAHGGPEFGCPWRSGGAVELRRVVRGLAPRGPD